MLSRYFRVVYAAAALAVASQASAATLVSVFTTDDVYGSFFGTISNSAVGSAATLQWRSAGYGWAGNIGLTDSGGTILFNITTSGDVYQLFAAGSGNGLVGASCAGNATACLALPNNVWTSLYSTVSSANGGAGICCGGSDIWVKGTTAVPEPASWALMIAGFGMVGGAMRRRESIATV